jgi:hypothetical protein
VKRRGRDTDYALPATCGDSETDATTCGVLDRSRTTRTAAPTWISACAAGSPQAPKAQAETKNHRRITVGRSQTCRIVLTLPVRPSAIFPLGTLPRAASLFVVDPGASGKEVGQAFRPDTAGVSLGSGFLGPVTKPEPNGS